MSLIIAFAYEVGTLLLEFKPDRDNLNEPLQRMLPTFAAAEIQAQLSARDDEMACGKDLETGGRKQGN